MSIQSDCECRQTSILVVHSCKVHVPIKSRYVSPQLPSVRNFLIFDKTGKDHNTSKILSKTFWLSIIMRIADTYLMKEHFYQKSKYPHKTNTYADRILIAFLRTSKGQLFFFQNSMKRMGFKRHLPRPEMANCLKEIIFSLQHSTWME